MLQPGGPNVARPELFGAGRRSRDHDLTGEHSSAAATWCYRHVMSTVMTAASSGHQPGDLVILDECPPLWTDVPTRS